MKIKSLPLKLSVLCLFFFTSLQLASAQMTVFNNTGCDLYVAGINGDNASICGPCSVVALNFIPAGGNITIAPNASCNPQRWLAIHYSDTFGGSIGTSFNPNFPCGANQIIPACNTNVNWFGNPSLFNGPVFVVIQ